MKSRLYGTVKFFFQPAEEGAPVGGQADDRRGVWDPHVDAVFGLHVFPGPGDSVVRQGRWCSRCGGIDTRSSCTARRRTAGSPRRHRSHRRRSQIVLALQTIVNAVGQFITSPVALTVGVFKAACAQDHSGQCRHDRHIWMNTTRAFVGRSWRASNVAGGIAQSAGATASVTIEEGYPVR